ncbi:MAG: helix-turn-helix transcriptional regulator [Planctomycetes bacterium]|nr:helix-turn-helix transcriptional regulator [Planctomycetota bacterium]
MERGRALWISQGVRHQAIPDSDNLPRFFALRYGIYDNRTGEMVGSPCKPAAVLFELRDLIPLEQLLLILWDDTNKVVEEKGRQDLVSPLLFVILSKLVAQKKLGQKGAPLDARIMRIQRYLQEHPRDRSEIAVLAAMAGLTTRYFSLLFRQQTGMSPKHFQVQQRIRHAHFLLKESGLSVNTVATLLDYPDPFVFSKQFKSVTGFPPSELTMHA